MANPLVSLLMGSDSDLPTVQEACKILQAMEVPFEVRVLSAHRCPEELTGYVKQAEQNGVRVFIAAAGGAAHLAGVVAAHTIRPVLGIPIQTSALNGLDSLLSIVQMPGGVPVGTMAIGNAGARNAGLFAVQILALADASLAEKLRRYRTEQTGQVLQKDQKVRQQFPGT
ncbi:MAG: 5-(carboxyamino)imidazole ribonucleotide mutase [Planctomycetes bacterium]|nr:5-(carboxyamino)imidazole ribonucleotide mutase [Planctomycetota bacterium]